MKIFVRNQWKTYPLQFRLPMQSEIGGVAISANQALETTIRYDLHREILQLSVQYDEDAHILLVEYIDDDGESNFYGYLIELTPEESYTYATLIG